MSTSKRMLLGAPGGLFRPNPIAIVQKATNVNAASMSFGANTTPGNLLVYCAEKRDVAIAPPSTGSWTAIRTGQHQRTTTTNENGFGIYAMVETTPRATFNTPSPSWGLMYEISNAPPIASITSLFLSDQAANTVLDLGSLGVADATRLAIGLWGFGPDNANITVTPGAWIRDFYDLGSSTGDTAFNNYPYTYIAHRYGTDAAIEARIDLDSSEKFGGAAVLL